jgi:hypothetical protein
VYARHLGHPEGVDAVHRPTVALPGAAPRPGVFDARWLARSLDEIDVVHVHGVAPGQTPEEVAEAADVVRASGTPLVVTGYHLSDPGGTDPQRYAEQMDTLIPRADAVVTLTEPAAEEMRRRWNVEPLVLPHPHAVDFVRMREHRPARRSGQFLVGTHLATLRVPVDPVLLVDALTRAMQGIEDARLIVHVHETVLDSGSASYDPMTIREIDRLVRSVGGALRRSRPFTESQLWDHLFALDVSIVPGLFGSHSVWPEACADLGTQALLPEGLHAAAQRPCLTYEVDDDVDTVAESLSKALWTAKEQGCVWRADPQERWAERVHVAESLRSLYERLLHLDRR